MLLRIPRLVARQGQGRHHAEERMQPFQRAPLDAQSFRALGKFEQCVARFTRALLNLGRQESGEERVGSARRPFVEPLAVAFRNPHDLAHLA
ncbi:MAG: hypothetical protein IT492_04940 [Gammaproteobacteria bacterium]|nr:hypothetical protein [Gammaproteobacteria bacterium]